MNRQGVDMRVACTHLHSDDTHEDRMKIKSLHWMMREHHTQIKSRDCSLRLKDAMFA